MKNHVRRWYEQDEYLKAFMSLLKDLDVDEQCEIAVDIIIKASSMIDRDYEKIISEVSAYDPNDYNRWYDVTPNIHLAIESLRDLTDEQRKQIIDEFSDEIIDNHFSEFGEIK